MPPPPPAPTAPVAAAPPAPAPTAAVPIPYYYDRAITASDLQGKSLKELSLIRNTIFARAGNPFRKQWLHTYFSSQPWYHPLVQQDGSKLSPLDYKNADFVADFESKISRVELEARRNALVATAKTDTAKADVVELVLVARALGEDAWSYDLNLENLDQEMEVTPFDDPRILDGLVKVEQLKDLSRRDLRILRNMVYARHGRSFKSVILQSYFDRMAWYKPDPAFNEKMLSEIDRRNVAIIRSVEDSIGGPMTDQEHMAEDGWLGGA